MSLDVFHGDGFANELEVLQNLLDNIIICWWVVLLTNHKFC